MTVAALAVGGWSLHQAERGGDTSADDLDRTEAPTSQPTPTPTPLKPVHHLSLQGGDKRLQVLVLREPGWALLCMLRSNVPATGVFRFADSDLRVRVRHSDPTAGLVLLQVDDPRFQDGRLPAGLAALELSQRPVQAGDRLQAVPPGSRQSHPVRVQARPSAAFLTLADALPPGSVLVDDQGRAAALATTGKQAADLSRLRVWMRGSAGQSMPATELFVLQRELRRNDPSLVLEDTARTLSREPLTLGDVERAIQLLEANRHKAANWSRTQEFDRLLEQAAQARVRVLAATDMAAALAAGDQALLRYPQSKALLADMVLLRLQNGDSGRGLQLYQQLVSLSAQHAKSIADRVGTALTQRANALRRQRRLQDAQKLLAEATNLFPRRADLQFAKAETLLQLDAFAEALAAARLAAELDRSLRQQLARFQRAYQLSVTPGVHQIRFDPRTRTILTKANVAGRQVRFLVDTGASLTTVPTAVARQLGLLHAKNRRARVSTASGTLVVPVVTLPSLSIGPLRANKVEAAVIDLPGARLGGTGLLGMNVLRRYNVQIDNEQGRLILRQKGK